MWPLLLYFALVLLLVSGMLLVSYVLGERHRERATGVPYEAGIESEGSARVRRAAKFYMIAMFFVVFDLEAVFLFSWAAAVRELGWTGFCEAAIFTVILLAALLYLARVRALNWLERNMTSSTGVGDAVAGNQTARGSPKVRCSRFCCVTSINPGHGITARFYWFFRSARWHRCCRESAGSAAKQHQAHPGVFLDCATGIFDRGIRGGRRHGRPCCCLLSGGLFRNDVGRVRGCHHAVKPR